MFKSVELAYILKDYVSKINIGALFLNEVSRLNSKK